MQRRATEIIIVVGVCVVVAIVLALVLRPKPTHEIATDGGVPALEATAQQLLELCRNEIAAATQTRRRATARTGMFRPARETASAPAAP
jgi:hypothetical protein